MDLLAKQVDLEIQCHDRVQPERGPGQEVAPECRFPDGDSTTIEYDDGAHLRIRNIRSPA